MKEPLPGDRPPASAAARAEYLARIHRVMDHVERHLDERLTLEDLARVACVSPFHFHRVFTACVGESLYQFIMRLLTIYHDNPEITDEDKLRISACVTVPAGTKPEGEIGVMQVDGGRYAVASFELDPSEYGAAWNWLMGTWLPSSGHQPEDRHCFELYLNDPDQHPQKKHRVEIWEPVRPL